MVSILTWNIWFDQRHIIQRTNSIVNILNHYSPDVICLQEVIKLSLDIILNDSNLSEKYDFYYDPSLVNIRGKYGEIIMIKKELNYTCQFISVPFKNSRMGRRINALNIDELNLDIINVHLESVFRNNSKPKREQLEFLTSKVVLPERNLVVCGDMNLDINDDEKWANNMISKCGLKDICAETELTYDCDKNTNAYIFKSRLDRVLCKGLNSSQHKLIGTKVIPEIGIHPSDHFGILCVLT